jgi:PhzF family phenazine biosynthesis protein
MEIAVHQVNAFSTEPFGGNPVFVLQFETGSDTAPLARIAAQLDDDVMGVLDRGPGGIRRLRFFDAAGQHCGAGHVMLAAAHVALAGRQTVDLHLHDGTVRTVRRQDGRIVVPWPVMDYQECSPPDDLVEGLGLMPAPCLVSDFGYVAVLPSHSAVRDLAPDLARLARLDRGAVIATAPGEQSDIVVRVFAPKLGLPEDPVCGTAHRIIVPFWAQRFGRGRLHSRHLSSRGGDLWCVSHRDTVTLAGHTLAFLRGSIELPDD